MMRLFLVTVMLALVIASAAQSGSGQGAAVSITQGIDGLTCVVPVGITGHSFKWYRNDILLKGESNSVLTSTAMRTFYGNPAEFTPASSHSGHTVRGYEFTCEVVKNGSKVGDASVYIGGPCFDGPVKGVNLANWDTAWATRWRSDHTLETLLRTNANWVSIWSMHVQDGIDSTAIREKRSGFPNTVTDDQLIYQIEKAHQFGLKVILYPQIWIAYPDGSASPWERPSIVPSDEWFAAYKDFIVSRANIAERTGVDLFTIGVELESTVRYEDEWLDIISSVRNHYSGPVVYSSIACCQGGLEPLKDITWFATLDYIGLSSNLEARSGNYDPTVTELVEVYEEMAAEMEEIHDTLGKPVIFLETSAPSLDGATISPFDRRDDVPDFQEQADYYDAFFQTFANKPWVMGIFWNQWNVSQELWYRDDRHWPFGVTFLNKPAERVLTSWYGGLYRGVP